MISNRIESPVSIHLRLLFVAFALLVSESELAAQWQPAVHIRHKGNMTSAIFRTSVRDVVMAKYTAFDGSHWKLFDLGTIVADTVPFRHFDRFVEFPMHLYGRSIQCDGNPAFDYVDIAATFNILTPQEDSLSLPGPSIREFYDYDSDGLDDVLMEELGTASGIITILFGDSTLPLRQKTRLHIVTEYDISPTVVVIKTFGRELRVVSYGWNDNAMRGVMGMYGISLDSLASRPDTVDLQPIQVNSFYIKPIYEDSLRKWNLAQGGYLHLFSDSVWYYGRPDETGGKMTKVTSTTVTLVTVDSSVYRLDGATTTPGYYFGLHSWAGSGRLHFYTPLHDTILVCRVVVTDSSNVSGRLYRGIVDDQPILHLTVLDSISWSGVNYCGGISEAAVLPDIDGDGASEILMNRDVSESTDSCVNYFEIYLSTGKILSAYTEPQRMELPQVTRTQGGWLVPRSLCTQAPDHVPAYAINGSLIGILSASDFDSEYYFIADPPNAITGVVLTVFGTCSLRLQ